MAIYPDLTDKKVLVTGCANGIGKAQATAFLEQGAQVVGLDKEEPNIDEPNFLFIKIDLANESKLKQILKAIDVEIICNTAGILDDYLSLREVDDDQIANLMDVNLRAYRIICQEFIQRQQLLTIVNMSSYASLYTDGGGYAYSVSKAGINALTQHIAFTCGPKVRANAIAPCLVETDMAQQDIASGFDQELIKQTSLGRYAQPKEIAELSLFLASDASSYITGQVIQIDGGYALGKKY